MALNSVDFVMQVDPVEREKQRIRNLEDLNSFDLIITTRIMQSDDESVSVSARYVSKMSYTSQDIYRDTNQPRQTMR